MVNIDSLQLILINDKMDSMILAVRHIPLDDSLLIKSLPKQPAETILGLPNQRLKKFLTTLKIVSD